MKLPFVLVFAGLISLTANIAAAQSQALAEKAQHAKELMAAGRAAEAVPIYSELIKSIPNNSGLILNLGLALDLSGRSAKPSSSTKACSSSILIPFRRYC